MFKNHYDSAFLIVGNAMSRVLMIFSTIIMVKLLGDNIYSKYALLYNGLLSLQVFLVFGLNAVATRRIAQGENLSVVFSKIFKIVSIIAIPFFLVFYLISQTNFFTSLNYFREVNFLILVFSALSLVFFSLTVSFLYGLENKKKIALFNIFNALLILVFISVSSLSKNLNLIFFSYGLANIIGVLFFLFKHYRISDTKKLNISNEKEYVKQGFPIFLSALLVTPIIGVLYTFMNAGGLGEEISVFSVAMQWYNIILFVPGVLANLLLVDFSKKNKILDIRFYTKQVFINFIITLVISLFVFILLYFILPIYGKLYQENLIIFVIFILVALVNSFNTVAGQFFISINRQIFGFYFNLVWAVLIMAMTKLALNYGYGLKGVVLSFLLAYLLHAFNQNIYIYRFLKSSKNG
ncbi:oligosaccharide flippase family protein [Acinetobacter baumannii]|uniref:oligosaccharide flippase family protein n=1 Tax=Acinetobacter baumannii TaxID=470 RepID=UPI001D17AF9A|nr:oligosaccharide flippase family protein [Acinetobacter baumannii]MDC4509119.1 oligosaccharide flippase family protein [Acinetobacter baumannii]